MPSEHVTLQSFVAALAELDSPLDREAQKKVNEVGKYWKDQPMLMANKLIEVARSYPALNGHYTAAQEALFNLYNANSKNLSIPLPEESNTVPASQDKTTTIRSPRKEKLDFRYDGENDEKAPGQTDSQLCSVLLAKESVKKAKELKEELTKQPDLTTSPNTSEANTNKKVRMVARIKDLINFVRNRTETNNLVNNSDQPSSQQAPYYVWVSTIF